MPGFLSRLIGLSEPHRDQLGRGSLAAVDGGLVARHTCGMPSDLIAVDVHTDDVGDYNVTEPGWYAIDDAGQVMLGPFTSLAECERAMRDRKRMTS